MARRVAHDAREAQLRRVAVAGLRLGFKAGGGALERLGAWRGHVGDGSGGLSRGPVGAERNLPAPAHHHAGGDLQEHPGPAGPAATAGPCAREGQADGRARRGAAAHAEMVEHHGA